MCSQMTWRETSTLRVTVKAIQQEPGVEHQRKKRRTARFSLPGLFRRMCAFLHHPYAQINNELPSWRSLFFYRCADVISFAPLKSQGIDSRCVRVRETTVSTEPSNRSLTGFLNLAEWMGELSNQVLSNETPTQVKLRADVATPPPCSPKSIYVLASLVRQGSIEYLMHQINASNQARNPAPL